MKLYYCQACGKVSVDRYGKQPLSAGWDESCFINAVEVDADKHWETVRERIDWGTLGKDGLGPRKTVTLPEMSTDHIKAILRTQHQISLELRWLFKKELRHRAQ